MDFFEKLSVPLIRRMVDIQGFKISYIRRRPKTVRKQISLRSDAKSCALRIFISDYYFFLDSGRFWKKKSVHRFRCYQNALLCRAGRESIFLIIFRFFGKYAFFYFLFLLLRIQKLFLHQRQY